MLLHDGNIDTVNVLDLGHYIFRPDLQANPIRAAPVFAGVRMLRSLRVAIRS